MLHHLSAKIRTSCTGIAWFSAVIKSIALAVAIAPALTQAIVIRHDVADEKYHATADEFPPLATLYNIGVHGTLVHPQWVVTAAHAVFCMNPGQQIKVGEEIVAVSGRFSYPDYRLGEKHDIALIKLARPVSSIKPAELYGESNETDKVVWFIGVGGTGTGKEGETIGYKENNGKLRKAQNKIIATTDTDLVFKFEQGDKGEALEGVSGNGDSGGPAYIKQLDSYVLLGVSSRIDSWFYDVGEYGVTELYSRVSVYRDWIQRVISAKDDAARLDLSTQDPFLQANMPPDNMDKLCASIAVQ